MLLKAFEEITRESENEASAEPASQQSRQPSAVSELGVVRRRYSPTTMKPQNHTTQTTLSRLLEISSCVFLAVVLIAGLGTTVRAENKKAEEAIIVAMSSLELTVSRGHDVHVTYKIPKDVILTFNGLPATVADLRAGMMVTIRPDASGQVALAIRAHNAPRSVKR